MAMWRECVREFWRRVEGPEAVELTTKLSSMSIWNRKKKNNEAIKKDCVPNGQKAHSGSERVWEESILRCGMEKKTIDVMMLMLLLMMMLMMMMMVMMMMMMPGCKVVLRSCNAGRLLAIAEFGRGRPQLLFLHPAPPLLSLIEGEKELIEDTVMKMNESVSHSPLEEYEFERRFDERQALEWMQENWSKSFMFCGLYAALIFGGQHFMRERPKLNLRKPLVLWSLSLAIFSIIGAVRTGWYMMHVLTTSGFKQSVCDTSFYSAPVSKFWAYAFVLSKAPELGKTSPKPLLSNRLEEHR
ncbi:Elongation of very long chain fatty acids protein 6 [Merluccius polli]|uniref:Elongation of very long chain fatty acids protein n=1 Tax=Merluccius polli TaxID=89951 RepID=A0AA47MTI3_MERPO|nr:Elongation of very long chain fatty acids protein 6 [Merluccius polli]